MNEYQADRSLSITSNINLFSSESINNMQDILQCPLCVFATSNRSEFTKHLINLCIPKHNSNLKAVLTHLPILKSFLNQDNDNYSPLALTAEYVRYKTGKINESSLRVSRMNQQSNVSKRDKNFRDAKNCKHCNFIASTKMEYWEHMRCHIKGFTCSECSFVTKYKHHMNHHWLSVHDGSKPFKCKKCLYTCVSKSMLSSHLKKHSNIYPYRCADCTFKTKFCNALKKHLQKKEHQPAMVLNADGSPNPFSIIDVYGTKRGPKQKSSARKQEEVKNTITPIYINGDQFDSSISSPLSLHSPIPHYLTVTTINGVKDGHWVNYNDINKNLNQPVATFSYNDLVAAFNLSNHVSYREDATFYENIQKMDCAQSDTLTEYTKILNARNKMPEIFMQNLPVTHFDTTNNISELYTSDSMEATTKSSTFVAIKSQLEYKKTESTDMPLNLSMAEVIRKSQLQFQTLTNTNALKITEIDKHKARAKKLERCMIIKKDKKTEQIKNEYPSDNRLDVHQAQQNDEAVADLCDDVLICHYCEIIFGNVIMFTAHMGCHSFNDPYTCNICGRHCIDKLSFFLHITRSEHEVNVKMLSKIMLHQEKN
ncbi:protein hunchback [Monomorium pharaonis]|uniref:protein hunchback n=1 Tax=Monomorium pharaonis TaxID=307658 RepID=UPI00063FB908|nr:protein hunchback [Monomorium pharaonis]XP_036143477.1 protein hunchback [Monomorium pharaonis]XP_036143478.1 protein hunchback [Monomorium pharaonis]XP_036143479.1 protein hunchback [Monomorium pharaonis]XP_036143480.1 protein hunchback [Monomorium pharaonis]XP_036143481.1 protein hunchback [Monomorium pharaonis]